MEENTMDGLSDTRPMRVLPKFDAHQLRVLVEAAASLRGPEGMPFFGVVGRDADDRPTLSIVAGKPGSAPPKDAVFEIDTRDVAERPAPSAVIIECDGEPHDLVRKYDAVFWSEAAVEKFVLPYYASKSMWEAAAVLSKLSYHWYGTVPPDTDAEPDPTHGGGSGARAGGARSELLPYALAHTPDSDWSMVSEGDGEGARTLRYEDLHLFYRTAGGMQVRALSELPDPPAGGDRGR